jgi:hypothetical protein
MSGPAIKSDSQVIADLRNPLVEEVPLPPYEGDDQSTIVRRHNLHYIIAEIRRDPHQGGMSCHRADCPQRGECNGVCVFGDFEGLAEAISGPPAEVVETFDGPALPDPSEVWDWDALPVTQHQKGLNDEF